MTGTSTITIEQDQLPGVSDIELEVEYTYEYTPGRNRIDPDDCYPAEEESEINLQDGFEGVIMAAYIKTGREAIEAVKKLVEEMNDDGLPREWAEDSARNHYADRADSDYKNMREE